MKMNTPVKRRSFLRTTVSAAIAFPMINMGAYRVFAASETKYSARAIDLVNQNQVFDMLSIMAPFSKMMSVTYVKNPKKEDGFEVPKEHIETLLASGVDVFHPAVGLAADHAAAFVGRLNALVAEYPDVLRRVDSLSDLKDLKKGERIGFIVGIQNSDHFREPDDVNLFYTLGQRISQLTYNSRNLIGTGSTDRSDGGLSDFGVSIVERMNEVGMAVDVSHCGDRTTLDAFELSKKPVLVTHSNVRELAGGHIRCKTDEAIKAMARSGSVMGITGVRNFVSTKEPTTVENIIDHIDYVAKLTGIEHVGVGSDMDMDGYDDIPEPAYSALKGQYKASYAFRDKMDTDGFDHPKRIFDLTEGLIRRGYSDEHISLVLGNNFKRALGDIWKS
ncbi:dipeptidase [Emcibacter sp.]|uniref:dipeptidase n=1 Tax=Emcibacter sp. TaxID=1979954 RepID=UPI002AA63793|nr:membrane dipeptidase [Emcibacter sp.]